MGGAASTVSAIPMTQGHLFDCFVSRVVSAWVNFFTSSCDVDVSYLLKAGLERLCDTALGLDNFGSTIHKVHLYMYKPFAPFELLRSSGPCRIGREGCGIQDGMSTISSRGEWYWPTVAF